MKRTQRKDAVRNIKKRIVSYLSVCLVIMLGLGGFFISSYAGAGVEAKASEYYGERGFKNYELISSLGITDDDLAQIRETEGITDAEGAIRADGTLAKDDLKCNVIIISMTERISVPEVTEGRVPSACNECMVGEDFAALSGISTGDKVRISMEDISASSSASGDDEEDEDSEDGESGEGDESGQALYEEEFTVTGFMHHPDYIRRKSDNTVVLPLAAFNEEATDGCYTHAFVKAEETEGVSMLSDRYFDSMEDTDQALEELAERLSASSAARVKQKAYDYIDEEWAKALAELESAQGEIDSNEAALDSELAKARKKLTDAEDTLAAKISEATKKIKSGEMTLAEYEKKLAAAKKELSEKKKQLADGKEALAKAKAELKKNKEAYEKARAAFEENISGVEEALTNVEYLIENFNDTGIQETEVYKAAEQAVAGFIVNNADALRKILELANDSDVTDAVKAIDELLDTTAGEDALAVVQSVSAADLEEIISMAQAVKDGTADHFTSVILEKIRTVLKAIADARAQLDAVAAKLAEAEATIAEKEKLIADAEKQLAAAEKELAAGEKTLNAYKAKLKNAKSELKSQKASAESRIRAGWNEYYSKKAQYEAKLEEAKALLAENREAAEAKLAEARAEVEDVECKWLVLGRNANAGYIDVKSNVAAIKRLGIIFGMMFLLITAMVCFSTLAIIIEEQKKLVGTVKAFGFHKSEVLGKYMMFGVSAAAAGSIAGVALALGMSGFVLQRYHEAGLYQFDAASTVVTVPATIAACLGMIVICAVATVIACSGILRNPASVLMKGGSAGGRSGRRKTSSRRRGSLYSRLIVRNMRDDLARVIISVIIIAAGTTLVGTGITLKLSYDGMSDRQQSEVYKYDVRVDLGEGVTDETQEELEGAMEECGASYTLASYETHLYRNNGRLDALYVLTGDPGELGDYFAVKDSKTGETLTLPDDGILVQKKMREVYGMDAGTEITVLNNALEERTAAVKGSFQNYVGRLVITSPEGHEAVFGEAADLNCYYVKAGPGGTEELESSLLEVSEDISFEEAGDFASKFSEVSFLYNIVIYVTVGIAILMSFMILTNLSNISLNRRKTELSVMRVNGFSIKQARGYLAREAVVTTTAGVILGVLIGFVLAPVVIKAIEQADLQFVRNFQPVAWAAAVVLESLFSVIINSLVFRKVKDLDLRDIA